ncbi:MAG TPA: RraA family protein [bacterium]|nr:RraA family protein [bacterium]
MDPIIERLSRLVTSTLGHFVDEGFLDIDVRPVFHPVRCCGRAVTVDSRDNAINRRGIREARPGGVLVIARGGDVRHASFGGMLALAARQKGIAGIVIDGPVCDLPELLEFRLPVFARGISALTSRPASPPGTVGEPVTCGGVRVAPGDYVLADDDGVLIIPPSRVEAIVERGEAASRRERETRAALEAGKTLEDIAAQREGR